MSLRSWISSANDDLDFTIHNIPFGLISTCDNATTRPATRLGSSVIDLSKLATFQPLMNGLSEAAIGSLCAVRRTCGLSEVELRVGISRHWSKWPPCLRKSVVRSVQQFRKYFPIPNQRTSQKMQLSMQPTSKCTYRCTSAIIQTFA